MQDILTEGLNKYNMLVSELENKRKKLKEIHLNY